MDVKIENKDIKTLDNGDTVYITGTDEIRQRVKLACSVKKGSFVYDREFGAEVSENIFSFENAKDRLEIILNEAVVNIPDIYVGVVSITDENDAYTVNIRINYKGQDIGTEVIVFE
ncbi:MAG: DUF2634 domain-containing protein [Oscillospiraceae bacterium]|nr:DUF2634 domain-containing protein [Candidatus Ruminococcus equi]